MNSVKQSGAPHIAIVGAGMAGLACAQRLGHAGLQPILIEKSRGLGGRVSTRRTESGDMFDHGAQYVTARSSGFRHFIEEASRRGTAKVWLPDDPHNCLDNRQPVYVGSPGMNGFAKAGQNQGEFLPNTQVAKIVRTSDRWRVVTDSGEIVGDFDVVILTAPAPQSRALLEGEREIDAALSEVGMAPCWALMISFSSRLETGYDVWKSDSHELAWIARNSAKPDRTASNDCWVAHGSASWSAEHLALDPPDARDKLTALMEDALDIELPSSGYRAAHRWRHALTSKPLGRPYLSNPNETLFVGGDWCLGARVEYAFESGISIADQLLKRL
ncbi:MAG: FAD-dependent oxidoreductase [Proteobacteria bacterium]|nr:FAD-dependent oxidoreductase [Pseudomonadota bacterium]